MIPRILKILYILDQFNGVNSARDNWVTNFSNEKALIMQILVDNYNSEIDRLIDILDSRERINLVNKDETFISLDTRTYPKIF